jgi:site-specific recombinase XerD
VLTKSRALGVSPNARPSSARPSTSASSKSTEAASNLTATKRKTIREHHTMRATFITATLDNGASLEDAQRDVGRADSSTTKLYDRRGHNPKKSDSFFANY